jgi:uncharacterized membrane protein YukC
MNEDDPYFWSGLGECFLCVCDENSSFTDLFAWHDEDTFTINGKSILRQNMQLVSLGNPQPKELGK